jgi:hypothetical protein
MTSPPPRLLSGRRSNANSPCPLGESCLSKLLVFFALVALSATSSVSLSSAASDASAVLAPLRLRSSALCLASLATSISPASRAVSAPTSASAACAAAPATRSASSSRAARALAASAASALASALRARSARRSHSARALNPEASASLRASFSLAASSRARAATPSAALFAVIPCRVREGAFEALHLRLQALALLLLDRQARLALAEAARVGSERLGVVQRGVQAALQRRVFSRLEFGVSLRLGQRVVRLPGARLGVGARDVGSRRRERRAALRRLLRERGVRVAPRG